MAKKSLEDNVNDFIEMWGYKEQVAFLRDIIPLFDLYNVDDEDDWVRECVGEENELNVRLIRTVYLISKIAEFHAGRLCMINANFKNLWQKMENELQGIKQ